MIIMIGGASEESAAAACRDQAALLGVHRTLDSTELGDGPFGSLQYPSTLPLNPGEYVLTFDDGPHPEHTPRILQALQSQCVRATFFVVGRYADAHPDLVREIARAGHTIANHSWSHPNNLRKISRSSAKSQIRRGEESISAALAPAGLENRVVPFFRFPGLNDNSYLIGWLSERKTKVLSADIGTDDWRRVAPQTVYRRALANMEAAGRGIVVMHDTKERTAKVLPKLLEGIKQRGYRIVHLAPRDDAIARLTTQPDEPRLLP